MEEEIAAKKQELMEIQAGSKDVERVMQAKRDALAAEKTELMEAVKARMELIEMIKTDVYRMGFEDAVRVQEVEFKQPVAPAKK